MVLGDDLPAGISAGESNAAFSEAGALEPPYDQEMLDVGRIKAPLLSGGQLFWARIG